jgi:hypothetical protein
MSDCILTGANRFHSQPFRYERNSDIAPTSRLDTPVLSGSGGPLTRENRC